MFFCIFQEWGTLAAVGATLGYMWNEIWAETLTAVQTGSEAALPPTHFLHWTENWETEHLCLFSMSHCEASCFGFVKPWQDGQIEQGHNGQSWIENPVIFHLRGHFIL